MLEFNSLSEFSSSLGQECDYRIESCLKGKKLSCRKRLLESICYHLVNALSIILQLLKQTQKHFPCVQLCSKYEYIQIFQKIVLFKIKIFHITSYTCFGLFIVKLQLPQHYYERIVTKSLPQSTNQMFLMSPKTESVSLHNLYLQKNAIHVHSLGQKSAVLQEERTLLNSIPYFRCIVEPATVCILCNKMLKVCKSSSLLLEMQLPINCFPCYYIQYNHDSTNKVYNKNITVTTKINSTFCFLILHIQKNRT